LKAKVSDSPFAEIVGHVGISARRLELPDRFPAARGSASGRRRHRYQPGRHQLGSRRMAVLRPAEQCQQHYHLCDIDHRQEERLFQKRQEEQ